MLWGVVGCMIGRLLGAIMYLLWYLVELELRSTYGIKIAVAIAAPNYFTLLLLLIRAEASPQPALESATPDIIPELS